MEEKQRAHYLDKFQLLNIGEQKLFLKLKEATPDYIVFSQVSMSQIFHIQKYIKGNTALLGEIGRKSVDFLLCRQDTSIVLAVELNGPHHEEEEQKKSDEKKRNALEEAGIPLVVFDLKDIEKTPKEIGAILVSEVVRRRKYEETKQERIDSKKCQEEKNTCESCDCAVGKDIIKWCREHEAKFSGEILCRACQKTSLSTR